MRLCHFQVEVNTDHAVYAVLNCYGILDQLLRVLFDHLIAYDPLDYNIYCKLFHFFSARCSGVTCK